MVIRMKYLKEEDFLKYFASCPTNHGLTIQQEPQSGETFLNFSTILPANFFVAGNVLPSNIYELLPEKIEVNFELVGQGKANDKICAIFKPWIVNVHDRNLLDFVENFFLYMHNSYYCCLVEQAVFREKITYEGLKAAQVAQDKVAEVYKFFGLNFWNRTETLKTERLKIERIEEANQLEILNFYRENWSPVSDDIAKKYFLKELNSWYKVTRLDTDTHIGFIRLYSENSSFRFGPFIEYILHTEYRRRGFTTEAVNEILEFIKRETSALYVFAEIDENNIASKKIIQNIGFSEIKMPFSNKPTYCYNILREYQHSQELLYENNSMKFGYLNKYKARLLSYME